MTISSCLSSAPRPGRPTTSAAYFARLDVPGANSCSCAFAIGAVRPAEVREPVRRRRPPVARIGHESSHAFVRYQSNVRRIPSRRPTRGA